MPLTANTRGGAPLKPPAQLRQQAADHDRDADFHARDAAKYAGQAAHWRKHGDIERARVAEINRDAAARCEERALLKALGSRIAASALEHQAARFELLTHFARRPAA